MANGNNSTFCVCVSYLLRVATTAIEIKDRPMFAAVGTQLIDIN